MSRSSFGLQTIAQKMSYLLKPLFQGSKKEFVMINNLVKNWPDIIGKKYSDFCYPKSVNFGKEKNGKLTVGVFNSAVGFFIENNSELIIERIASFYGFKSINKIIIKQEPKIIPLQKNEEIKLPKNQEEHLQKQLSNVENTDLAATLQKLGRMILKEKNDAK